MFRVTKNAGFWQKQVSSEPSVIMEISDVLFLVHNDRFELQIPAQNVYISGKCYVEIFSTYQHLFQIGDILT